MTHDELEAEVRKLREQVESLTELVCGDSEDDEPEALDTLEAQHGAFVARLKEKRR